jgi:hypothetical protein
MMTPEQRRTAIARILAVGVLRLQARATFAIAAETTPEPQNSQKSEPGCLEVLARTRLSGHGS